MYEHLWYNITPSSSSVDIIIPEMRHLVNVEFYRNSFSVDRDKPTNMWNMRVQIKYSKFEEILHGLLYACVYLFAILVPAFVIGLFINVVAGIVSVLFFMLFCLSYVEELISKVECRLNKIPVRHAKRLQKTLVRIAHDFMKKNDEPKTLLVMVDVKLTDAAIKMIERSLRPHSFERGACANAYTYKVRRFNYNSKQNDYLKFC